VADIHLAAIGVRASDGYVEILAVDTIDAGAQSFVVNPATQTIWIDITNSTKAIFANINGYYSEMHYFAYAGNILHDLQAAQADDEFLAKLRPEITANCELNADGGIDTMDYNCDAYLMLYDAIEFGDVYVSYELPASTVSTLLPYNAIPDLSS
jgi:hypothetical protein